MGGILSAFQHFVRWFHTLETRHQGHVAFTPDFPHACYQANGIVILVISVAYETSRLPSLEAVNNKLKNCLFNFWGKLASQRSRRTESEVLEFRNHQVRADNPLLSRDIVCISWAMVSSASLNAADLVQNRLSAGFTK